MTVLRLKYVDRFADRHGTVRHYFRRPGGERSALPGEPGSAAFMAAYQEALGKDRPAKAPDRGAPGTFARLASDYFRSSDFRRLKPSSQAVSRGIIEAFLAKHGGKLVADLERRHVTKIMGEKDATPAAANNLLKKLRVLIKFAIAEGWRADDPTIGIKKFREGTHHTWTEAEIAQFEARWPVGTRERTAFALHLFTAQRRGDVCSMVWPAYDAAAGSIDVVQEKTGVALTIPVHPHLRVALTAWQRSHMVILTNSRSKPYVVESYGNWMADSIAAAGLPERCVLHGLRKAACRRLAEAGCSARQIMAIAGHKSLEEAERYTEAADQKRMARQAVAKLRVPTLSPKTPNPAK